MGFFQTLSEQFRGTKLLFNFLFHGLHIGLFAFGWYASSRYIDSSYTNSYVGISKLLTLDYRV